MGVTWVLVSAAEVPSGDAWLSEAERALAPLEPAKRRDDWRLGRWAAKRLLGPSAEVLAAPDGAPVAAGAAISISHRHGHAVAAVSDAGRVGCDLERAEEWEWAAREAAAKVRRDGVVRAGEVRRNGDAFTVAVAGRAVAGRLVEEDGWVVAVAAEPAPTRLRRV